MSEFTPGPWIHSTHGHNILTADSMRSIAAVHSINPGHSSEKDRMEHLANARLIAAAPELLAACKLALTQFKSVEMSEAALDSDAAVLAQMESAVAKAEGQS